MLLSGQQNSLTEGFVIRDALTTRRQVRRSRRNRKTRYRAARFNNRRKPKGWLAPSLMSRVENILTWVRRLSKLCPITAISQELVRFDTQKMHNAEISGVEYQQGELAGYEVREYLLSKFGTGNVLTVELPRLDWRLTTFRLVHEEVVIE
jgi:hypothetical protein